MWVRRKLLWEGLGFGARGPGQVLALFLRGKFSPENVEPSRKQPLNERPLGPGRGGTLAQRLFGTAYLCRLPYWTDL